MKRLAFVIVILAGVLTAKAVDYQYLTIEKTDGTTLTLTAVGLSISYSDGNLVATNGTEKATLTLIDVTRMYFSNTGEATGIQGTVADTDGEVEIYDLNGRKISKADMRKGVYIIQRKGKATKIQVK